jgi:ATP-dependent protease ClpP protease subunit
VFNAANEYPLDQAKRAWASRHRWTRPAAETWASLVGEIDDRSVNKVIAMLDPDSPLNLTISSRGGNPLAAFKLFSALREHAPGVTCMTDDHCDSAAIIIYMAGDVRIASHNASFLLHDVECGPTGRPTAAALRSGAADIAAVDDAIVNLICCRSRRYPAWQLRQELAAETTLGPNAALLRGICTSVVD